MSSCSWTELKERTSQGRTLAILPVGCYEQHGPVLPLETDMLIATRAAKGLAARLQDWHCHIYPCLPYTTTEPNVNYCGTVSVSAQAFRAYLREVLRGIMGHPFEAVVVLNGHGSIQGSLHEVAFALVNQQFRRGRRPVRPILTLNAFDADDQIGQALELEPGRHADWKEFLMTWSILGSHYYDDQRLERLQRFAQGVFPNRLPPVLGIPAELRTNMGVQGKPLAGSCPSDYDRLAQRIWKILEEHLESKTRQALDDFRTHYADRA
ncbi:creatininase family protein [bacterium]|nr:creatininase family protein [bacterium]